jgi:transposase-like protein
MFARSASELADRLEEAILEGLTVFHLLETHRRCIKTGNMLERVNHEIKRCSRVVRIVSKSTLLLTACECELDGGRQALGNW